MNLPYINESFLSKDECSILILLIRRYAKKSAHPKPNLATGKRTEVHAASVFADGRPVEAQLLVRIRERCQTEIERNFSPKRIIYPAFTMLKASYSGDSHERHADNCVYDALAGKWLPNDTPYRAISCVIFLNDA